MARPIRVTLVRSPIGRPKKHRRILRALGLTKLNKSRVLYATPTIVGAVKKVVHLVDVEEVNDIEGK
ncbi:MAG TPA: 50S ribosomal protein L30 [Thermodesulforhabdus norvegica]|uniref:50S ribosomal protein L30 n=1 Tax=Thermodesulforhabdus norvegica TaxID=39841 RepID=A0A7C1AZ02_9BACT|nr:50S ribosomal protein L30 [Deltaproteobacteria bacterium]MBW2068356.1 50S ribosomal protein L30 [Deltaproteobacteria bacterium]HDL90476.1 50S ribosomal protein L30 [Thermodesulforhabdus norvegica]